MFTLAGYACRLLCFGLIAIGCGSFSRPAAAMDMSEAMCQSHEAVVQQSLTLRSAGVPVASAEDMADSAFRLDKNLYRVLISSIRSAYKDPEAIRQAIADGRWLKYCVEKVRGY